MAVENAAIVLENIIRNCLLLWAIGPYQRLRIEQGRLMPGFELTDDYNPLDAGLWNTISFNKGCYIGQETIARLDTYNGVKLNLFGVMKSSSSCPVGSVIIIQIIPKLGQFSIYEFEDGSAVATVSSGVKAGGAGGLVVTVESQTAILEELPFQVRVIKNNLILDFRSLYLLYAIEEILVNLLF
jgi:hypothetical protein